MTNVYSSAFGRVLHKDINHLTLPKAEIEGLRDEYSANEQSTISKVLTSDSVEQQSRSNSKGAKWYSTCTIEPMQDLHYEEGSNKIESSGLKPGPITLKKYGPEKFYMIFPAEAGKIAVYKEVFPSSEKTSPENITKNKPDK